MDFPFREVVNPLFKIDDGCAAFRKISKLGLRLAASPRVPKHMFRWRLVVDVLLKVGGTNDPPIQETHDPVQNGRVSWLQNVGLSRRNLESR